MTSGPPPRKRYGQQWWVVEQFNPDGSATFSVTTTNSGIGHPNPGPNETVYGFWSTKQMATDAVTSGSYAHAGQIYRGKHVGKGPLGLNVPGDQAPSVPNITNPLAGISTFMAHLSDGAMWRSVGWIALGVVLLVLGLVLWLRKPAAEIAGAALKGGL